MSSESGRGAWYALLMGQNEMIAWKVRLIDGNQAEFSLQIWQCRAGRVHSSITVRRYHTVHVESQSMYALSADGKRISGD